MSDQASERLILSLESERYAFERLAGLSVPLWGH